MSNNDLPGDLWLDPGVPLAAHLARAMSDSKASIGGVQAAEIFGRASTLAGQIVMADSNPDAPVSVLSRPHADLATGLVAAFLAGRPVLALDPRYPDAVHERTIAHSGARLLIAQRDLMQRAGTLAPRAALDICRAAHSPGFEVAHRNPAMAACISYTSGSTGTPKGVVSSGRRIVHNCYRHAATLEIQGGDVLSMLYSPAVFAGLRDILTASLYGIDLAFFDIDGFSANTMEAWIGDTGLTLLCTVPSLLRTFAATRVSDCALARVRRVYLGGEPIFSSDAAMVQQHFGPDCRLSYGYGTTETGRILRGEVDCDCHEADGLLVLTRPAEDVQVSVVDDQGTPVRAGGTGEAVVTSAYTASGYWRDEELTRRDFTSDLATPHLRSYRTGDLLRVLPNGYLHVGRIDDQLNIRGARVSPAEVEAHITGQPGVDQSVVVADSTAGGRQSFVAFVRLQQGGSVDTLRSSLESLLPPHALPRLIVPVDEFPLSSGGKIDRRALLPPAHAATDTSSEPLTATEKSIAAHWCQTLNLDEVSKSDSFFALGGDSLLGVRMLRLVSEEVGYDLPLSSLFEHPTLERLARLIDSSDKQIGRKILMAVQPEGDRTPLFLVNGQAERVAVHLPVGQPLYWLNHLQDRAHTAEESVEDLTVEGLRLLREVQPRGPYLLAGFSFGGLLAYEIAQRFIKAGEEVALLALIDTREPHRTRNDPNGQGQVYYQRTLLEIVRLLPWTIQRYITRLRIRISQSPARKRPPISTLLERNFQIFQRLAKSHMWQPYSDRVVLLTTDDSDEWSSARRRRWLEVIHGQLVVERVAGVKYHLDLMREPGVSALARHLNRHLDCAADPSAGCAGKSQAK